MMQSKLEVIVKRVSLKCCWNVSVMRCYRSAWCGQSSRWLRRCFASAAASLSWTLNWLSGWVAFLLSETHHNLLSYYRRPLSGKRWRCSMGLSKIVGKFFFSNIFFENAKFAIEKTLVWGKFRGKLQYWAPVISFAAKRQGTLKSRKGKRGKVGRKVDVFRLIGLSICPTVNKHSSSLILCLKFCLFVVWYRINRHVLVFCSNNK